MRELNESKDHLEESYNKAFDSNLEMTSENPFEANEEPLADEESPASSNKEPSASPNKEPAADKEHKSDD
jgi:hypothetical protein